jgi:hypothetical protein
MCRLLMLVAAASIAASGFVTTCLAQNARETVAPPADLHPPVNLDADTLRSRFASSHLGLKPQSAANASGLALPFGLDYNRDTKSLIMPLDQKSEWGVGVGLNLNSSKVIELSPNGVLGLQPKSAPGLMLHKKF